MENRFGAPASGTPEGSARREFELLLLLGGSRKAAVQLWLRKQRIYANAQQAAGRPATEAKGSRGAAERQAGGESKPETAAQAARRHRSEHRLREKHLARKIWAAVRVRKHLSRWCERARAAVAKRPAPSSTTSTAAAAVTNVEHDGVLWVWGRTEASGDAQSGTVGTWRRIPGVTFH